MRKKFIIALNNAHKRTLAQCINALLTELKKRYKIKIYGGFILIKKSNEATIRSSAAEYLTYIASVGDQKTASKFDMKMRTSG